MSGKQSAKPRFGGVFFFVRNKSIQVCRNYRIRSPTLTHCPRALQRHLLMVYHVFQQGAQQPQGCLLTLYVTAHQTYL